MNLDAWRHYVRARMFQSLRQPARALEACRVALQHDPAHFRARHLLAYLLANAGNHEEAETQLRELVRCHPGNATAWFNLGYLCEQRRRPAEAAAAFRESVRLSPKFDRAWYGLGLALSGQDNARDAADAFEHAAKLQSSNGHVWYQLGMSYHRLHEPDKVKDIVRHLDRFDRHMARKLILDTERADLAHIVADLRR